VSVLARHSVAQAGYSSAFGAPDRQKPADFVDVRAKSRFIDVFRNTKLHSAGAYVTKASGAVWL